MSTLKELCAKYKKGDWPDRDSTHSYIDVYEDILAPYRNEAKNILEIGLMSGESLRMWVEYFSGKVCGIDCDIKPIGGMADLTQAIADGLNISIGDAADPKTIKQFFNGVKFDVVIEDASHNITQQLDIYKSVKPYLSKDSIYIIEDVQDLDATRYIFEQIDREKNVTILDLRENKGRYDDVLILITDK